MGAVYRAIAPNVRHGLARLIRGVARVPLLLRFRVLRSGQGVGVKNHAGRRIVQPECVGATGCQTPLRPPSSITSTGSGSAPAIEAHANVALRVSSTLTSIPPPVSQKPEAGRREKPLPLGGLLLTSRPAVGHAFALLTCWEQEVTRRNLSRERLVLVAGRSAGGPRRNHPRKTVTCDKSAVQTRHFCPNSLNTLQ